MNTPELIYEEERDPEQTASQIVPVVQTELSVRDLTEQVKKVQEIMKSVMIKNEHYGVIPGTTKPTLYKAGAEKLAFTFLLAPKFIVKRTDLEKGHREYEVICTMQHRMTGNVIAQGVGLCTTMEKKYRYRRDGSENDNIADTYNTVLKMAKKRAQVDATLTATAASDIFTQDLEDNVDAETGVQIINEPTVTLEQPDGKCPECGSALKTVPAGVSKKTGKAYRSFIACSNRECTFKPKRN